MVDLWMDFWVRETETGQQVAQLHERYDDDDDDDDNNNNNNNVTFALYNWCLKQWFIPSNCVIIKKKLQNSRCEIHMQIAANHNRLTTSINYLGLKRVIFF